MLRRWLGLFAIATAMAGCAGGGPAAGRERCSTTPSGQDHVQLFYLLCHNAP